MKQQLLDGVSNQQLAQFTVLLGSLLQAKKAAGKAQTFSLNELANPASTLATFSDDQSMNFSDLKISNQNRDAVLSEAEASARAYAESRNRNAQPKNLSGFDSQLIQSVRTDNKRQSRFRGVKRHEKSTD